MRRDGKLVPATWGEAFAAIAAEVRAAGDRVAAVADQAIGAILRKEET